MQQWLAILRNQREHHAAAIEFCTVLIPELPAHSPMRGKRQVRCDNILFLDLHLRSGAPLLFHFILHRDFSGVPFPRVGNGHNFVFARRNSRDIKATRTADLRVVANVCGIPRFHLRKLMLEELQLRNYAQNTIRHYLRAVEDFARRFRCSPDRLGPRQIREYQAELFQKRKLSANSVGQHLAALRFFYIKTLRRAWSLAETPYPKKTRRLPTILSREEVAQLLHAARTPGERVLLMALYASGARNA